jgi:antitoxin ParD1/3/4
MAQMNISIPDALKGWAEQRVAEGRYSSTSDYVRDLVRRDQEQQEKVARLQAAIDEGGLRGSRSGRSRISSRTPASAARDEASRVERGGGRRSDEILAYGVEQFGEANGEAYVRRFDEAFALTAEYPLIGAVHEEVRPPIHGLPHGSHHILYDVLEDW